MAVRSSCGGLPGGAQGCGKKGGKRPQAWRGDDCARRGLRPRSSPWRLHSPCIWPVARSCASAVPPQPRRATVVASGSHRPHARAQAGMHVPLALLQLD